MERIPPPETLKEKEDISLIAKETCDGLFRKKKFNSEYLEEFSLKINSLNLDEFSDFIEMFGSKMEKRHSLPQGIFECILKKSFQVAKEKMNEGERWDRDRAWMFFCEVDGSVQLQGDFKPKNYKDLSSTDKTFLAFQKLYYQYPEQADIFWQILSQNGQTINEKIFIDGIMDMYWRPDVSSYFKSTALHAFNYLYSFTEKENNISDIRDFYKLAILQNLDFENPEKFNRTGHILEFLLNLYYVSRDNDFSEELAYKITPILKETISQQKGSYLLNQKTKYILEEIESDVKRRDNLEDLIEFDKAQQELIRITMYQPRLFKISKDYWAVRKNEGIFVVPVEKEPLKWFSKKDDLNNIKSQIHRNPQDYFYFLNGEEILITRLPGIEFKPLRVSDIFIERVDKTEQQREEDAQRLFDYQYLVSDFMREQVKKDFGLDINDFSMLEQNYFLQFIKSKNIKEIKPITKFIHDNGANGLKALFGCEYGDEFGDKIVETSDKMERNDFQTIIKEYSQIVDIAGDIKKMLGENISLQELNIPDDLKNNFSFCLYESILRRAKDLLIAPYPLLIEKKKAEFETRDIIMALQGLKKFLEIMRDFNRKKDAPNKINFEKSGRDSEMDNYTYNVKGEDGYEYKLKIGIRAEEIESGQARINFELDFKTDNPNKELRQAFNQEIIYKKDNKKREISRLRIAIDREIRVEKETISIDMGRDKRDDKDFKRSGDVMGRVLSFVSETGHHNPLSFDPRYAQKEVFSAIANRFSEYLKKRDTV